MYFYKLVVIYLQDNDRICIDILYSPLKTAPHLKQIPASTQLAVFLYFHDFSIFKLILKQE